MNPYSRDWPLRTTHWRERLAASEEVGTCAGRSWLLGLAALVVLGLAGPAFAAPITFTQSERFIESFSDEAFLCQDELYEVTVAAIR